MTRYRDFSVRLIRSSVKSLAKDVQLTGEFYRCRTRESNEMMPWTEVEMWEVPLGISLQAKKAFVKKLREIEVLNVDPGCIHKGHIYE